jgi:site-specific DNA recombinase
MGLRAGLYPRVSDDQDKTSRSVPQQVDDLRAVCGREGWRVADEYPEPDRSASRFAKRDRPQWARLMADLRAGRFDVVVLWEPSRGDRRLTGWSEFLDECRTRNVLIHVTSHRRTYDLSNARDWKSLAEDGIDSAWESEKTSMRIRRDLADAAERGRPHGRLAYGYMRQYDVRTGKLDSQVPHPEQAPVVAGIISRIADGEAVSAIVNDLATRSVLSPTGKPRWARGTICRLVLEGVVYIGKRRHNGGPLLDGDWEPLVPEDVYWRAVAVLSDPARKPRGGGIRPGRARWLLSYIATCAVCDGPLSVRHQPRAGSAQVAYYRCIRRGCVSAPAELLEGQVADEVMRWHTEPGRHEELAGRDDVAAQAARDEAKAERARLAGFEEDAIAGRISSASFARIAAGIEAHVAELDERAKQLTVPAALSGFWSRSPRHEMAYRQLDFLDWWGGMPVSARRSVVAALVASPGYLRLEPGHVVDLQFAGGSRGR